MSSARRILVFRFSAMGDVAMTVPVLRELIEQNPETQIILVSRPQFSAFFKDIPCLHFHPIEPKGKHQSLRGLYLLFKELLSYQPEAIADLHFNLRSRVLSTFFRFKGLKIQHVNKGREEKKRLTKKFNKVLKPLHPMSERYADVFRNLGFKLKLSHQLLRNPAELSQKIIQLSGGQKQGKWIGISPFAQHTQKVYPLHKMEQIVANLAHQGHKLFIFGGGAAEKSVAEAWTQHSDNIISNIGKLKLEEELELISHLDVMLSMDSAGMHMASLNGVPVVSVWGATHPYVGFLGYGQDPKNCVQTNLNCRPCSVYGNKTCHRGDFACMQEITENNIIERVINNIS